MTTKEFIEKIGLSTDMQAEISRCTSPGEAYAYAQKEGVTDSMEQFLEVMLQVKEATSQMSAADVDNVMGGSDSNATVSVLASFSAINVTATVAVTAAGACGL